MLVLAIPPYCFSQNVGIGINPTKARLEVNGAVGNTVAIFGGDSTGVSLQQNPPAVGFNRYNANGNRSMKFGYSLVQSLDMGSGNLSFDLYPPANPDDVSTTPRRILTMQQNGNVTVVGPPNNSSLFVSNTPAESAATAIFRGTQHNTVFFEQGSFPGFMKHTRINAGKTGGIVYINDISSGLVRVGDGSGKIGINIDPTDNFEVKQVNGRGLALINTNFNYWETFVEKNLVENHSDLYLYYNGSNLGNFYNGDGKWYNYSDQRVKTQLESVNGILPRVMALKPYQYQFIHNNPGNGKSMGFIAQEVEKLFPEITDKIVGEDLGYPGLTELYTLNYSAFGAIAIQAVKEQQEQIKELQEQVAKLRQRLAAAKKTVQANQQSTINNSK
jgi:hypothetical protein